MDFAFAACPFLRGQKDWARSDWADAGREQGIVVIAPPEPPAEMGILVTDRYWLTDDDEGATGFKYRAGEPTREIEWRQRG